MNLRLLMSLSLLVPAQALGAPVPLAYDEALQSALNRNPELQGSAAQLDRASGALLVAEGAYDLQLNSRGTYSSMTSESIREFGAVLSEFSSIDTGVGVAWLGTQGTSATLDLSTNRSRFNYELTDLDIAVPSETNEPQYQTRLAATISQSLLKGHKASLNLQALRQAQVAHSAAEISQSLQRQETLADTAKAYWGLLTSRELVKIAEEGRTLAAEEQRLVHARVDLGELAPVERSRVDALVVEAELDLLEARHTEQSSADVLLLLVGLPLDSDLQLSTNPDQPADLHIDLDAAQQAALSGSPALAIARLEEEGARADVEATQHALLPQLNSTASYGLLGYDPSQASALGELFRGTLPEWSMGLNFSMPVGNRAARGSLASASAVLAEKTIAREALERSIRQEVSAQLRTLSSAHSKIALAHLKLKLSRETLEAERALRSAGRSLEKDVLDALKDQSNARVTLEQAKVDYLLAIIELERLKGAL